jgi:DNA helicase II / ATP-dependent DNA helicase PcrA
MVGLDELNQEQRRAVEAGEGPVLIVAGPGTGKTKTLAARIAYLIDHGKVPPERILALTFTKKAAEEMRERVVKMLATGTTHAVPHISTFHALCHELLGNDLHFATDSERLQVIKQLMRPLQYKKVSPRELGLLISRAKNMAEDEPELGAVVQDYNDGLQELGLIDFDDLLVRTRDLLQEDADKRTALQERFSYILIDEFQDTNRLQYELLQLLRGTENMFVIGDPLQSIYGFRGANGGIFDQFKTDFPQALAIVLTINYRSVPEVVGLSNAIFTAAPNLQPHTIQPGRVRAVRVLNEYSEANWVLSEIQRAIGGGDMLRAVSDDDPSIHRTLKDFAILYRNRSAAITMQKCIVDSGLPYQVVGDGSPYERPQIQAVIALLRSALTGEPAQMEGFSANQTKALQDMLGQIEHALPHAFAEKIVDILGFEPSVSLQQFIGTLVHFADLSQAVDYFDRIAETHFYDPGSDAITLITIHASKGLEFPHVFLIATEDGVLPYARADPDEERRLFYVAVTRAKNQLDVLHAGKRHGGAATASPFITELDPAILPRETDPNMAQDQRRAMKRAVKRSQQTLF